MEELSPRPAPKVFLINIMLTALAIDGLKKTNMPKVTDDESRGALLTKTREVLHDRDLRLA